MPSIGRSIPRVEDVRFVSGLGAYTDDWSFENQAYLYILRSPQAHALIGAIDTRAAAAVPGVLCVLTGDDFAAEGFGTELAEMPPLGPRTRIRGTLFNPPNLVMPRERVRYVGEPIAIVVGETFEIARQAAELIEVSFTPLKVYPSLAAARAMGAQDLPIWDEAPGNLSGTIEVGDAAACAEAFARADTIVRLDVVNNRVIGSPLEPRAALGYVDPQTSVLTLVAGTQRPNGNQESLAHHVFKVQGTDVRVISPDMGGGFGTRSTLFPDYIFVLWCARRLGRPIKWLGDRSEAFLSDVHGRDSLWSAALALRSDGRILGLKVETWANIGAYPGHSGALVPVSAGPRVQTGVYDVPALDMQVHVMLTNTSNVAPYRGAGQPEAVYLIERLLDVAAIELGIDRVDLRRRNLLAKTAFPYLNAAGAKYDSGEYEIGMDLALRAADWAGFDARAAAAMARGKRRGIGLANYVQVAGGRPDEWGKIEVDGSGFVTFFAGTHSHGQGHATVYAQIVADQLGVAFEQVRIVEGDTLRVAQGGGTHGSRSLFKAGEIAVRSSSIVIDKALRLAALKYDMPIERVRRDGRHVTIDGTNFASDLFELARFAAELDDDAPADLKTGLSADLHLFIYEANFPSGTHICEVEVDPDTGFVEIVRFTSVDDAGRLVNPMIAEGQMHGGNVQGIGQALCEEIVYDETSGQLVTGSFMDYCLPRAADLPAIDVIFQEVASPTNHLGVKGIGESGSTGAPPAVISAIVDALKGYGVTHIEMPATSQKVWSAIQAAGRAEPDSGRAEVAAPRP